MSHYYYVKSPIDNDWTRVRTDTIENAALRFAKKTWGRGDQNGFVHQLQVRIGKRVVRVTVTMTYAPVYQVVWSNTEMSHTELTELPPLKSGDVLQL